MLMPLPMSVVTAPVFLSVTRLLAPRVVDTTPAADQSSFTEGIPRGEHEPRGTPEGFYQELIEASRHGHVLASASISGFYAVTND
jgi:hypothetical protein